jgi:hypothetical protein
MSRSILAAISLVFVLSCALLVVSPGCNSNSKEFGNPLYVGGDDYQAPERLVTYILVEPQGVNLAVGGMQQFKATATFSDGTSDDITDEAEWYADNAIVGEFEIEGGRFLAKRPGVAIVRCRVRQQGAYAVSTAGFVNAYNPSEELPPAVPLDPSASGTPEGVLLGWALNMTDGDLAGYNVYRAQTSAAHYATEYGKINEKPILYPPYLDSAVVSGWYFYRVTAQDLLGIQSAPSEQVAIFVTGETHYAGAWDASTTKSESNAFRDAFSTAF